MQQARGLYDRFTGGPEAIPAPAGVAAEAGYGATIIIQTNDEGRIGQIAQDEYNRQRGAQRRQLVR